jgi:hypothetical protein
MIGSTQLGTSGHQPHAVTVTVRDERSAADPRTWPRSGR